MHKFARYVVSGALASAPAVVLAGGFSLNEQSASAMGVANAGTAANPENATTVFFNPAGMSQLSGTNISFGAAVLDIKAELDGATGTATDSLGRPVNGGNGGDFVPLAVLPNVYLTHEVNDWMDVGFGIHAPYGLKADYNNDFIGRYFADKTELTAIALSPSIALNDGNGFSLGFGINLMYAEGRLSKFQDYSETEAQLNAALGGNGPALEEGYVDIQGDDLAATFTFGMLWEVNDRTQLGLSAQTGTELKLEGDATLTNMPQVSMTAGGLAVGIADVSEKVTVPLEIPESITFGARHRLTDTVTLLGGATWAKWSRFVALDVISREDNGAISAAGGPKYGADGYVGHVSENWEDTWQFNVGAIWQVSPAWALKAGYAIDQSPVPDAFRTARIPSDDREWLSLGTQYADAQSGWTVDVAAGMLLFDKSKVDEIERTVDDEPVGNPARFVGTYDLDAWSVGVQVSKSL
ncbi:OmpP1/FadL family transporter [Marinobacter zhejiangensis]|uniref:Long-chain fatty acid transport protein n=1 Tax=Marinobacter zhejiangensis TaxID=488535 RepID=A0A1I4MFF9_9GAMM|nr:outer membrane protein transport protein [Marinobacter zhejiangensis]SFM02152.1 long-chain fatty acid transport protein [Marinobacter zhejiangensis]